MSWSRFEYFLNAIFYSLWRGEIRRSKRIKKIVQGILHAISKLLLSERQYDVLLKRQQKYALSNKTVVDSMNIRFAELWVELFFSCYCFSLSCVLIGIFTDINSSSNIRDFFIIITIFPGYLIAAKAVNSKHRCLKYFKKFEKKDKRWHKKWRLISIIFRLGGVTSIILGLYVWGKCW